jgi:hypothetical protein
MCKQVFRVALSTVSCVIIVAGILWAYMADDRITLKPESVFQGETVLSEAVEEFVGQL